MTNPKELAMLKRLINWVKTQTFIGRMWQRYNDYAKLCSSSGYTAEVQNWLLAPSRLFMRVWRYVQLGPTRIVGKENLAIKERVIFCGNHSSFFDAIVMHPDLQGVVRYMGAYESMSGICGLKQIALTAIGAFAVDRSRGKTVVGPATNLLVKGERLMIYPEGKIDNSGKLGPFKMGPAVIATAAHKELGGRAPVGIVPFHICYHKRNVKTGNTFNYLKMGFSWRGGVTVYVGKPIWMHEHPDWTPEQIMDLLRTRILAFQAASGVSC